MVGSQEIERDMASDIVPPTPRVPDSGDERHDSPGERRGPVSGPAPQPASTNPPPSSGDELSVSLAESLALPHPDPFLGAFPPAGASPSGTPIPRPSPPGPTAGAAAPSSEGEALWGLAPPTTSDALAGLDLRDPAALNPFAGAGTTPKSFDALKALQLAATEAPSEPDGPTPSPSSFEAFSAIDLNVAPAPRPVLDPEESDEDEELPPRRASWPLILLVSYASAVTLGLIWVLWNDRERGTAAADPVPPADTRPDPGRRALGSRTIIPPPPITPDRVTVLGRPVRMGALEATPLEVVSGKVNLKRRFRAREGRSGGENALKLKVRLRNVSTDKVFAPLDEAFLRERESGGADSFIILGGGGRIELFPLAVESEWSIVGQEFRELGPDESMEALIVSAPDALGLMEEEMTWRIRLRTGINETEVLGVRIADHEIRPVR